MVKPLQGGVPIKHDRNLAVTSLEGRIDLAVARLDNNIDLILVVAVLAFIAPAVARPVVG